MGIVVLLWMIFVAPAYPLEYTKHTWYTQPNQDIKVVAEQLKKDNIHETIYNIEDWVLNNIKYNYFAGPGLRAQIFFEIKRANCKGRASIMMSLLRENNIPAKFITGRRHYWVEVPLEDETITLNSLGKEKIGEWKWV